MTLKLYIRKNFCKSSSSSPRIHVRWLWGCYVELPLHHTKSPCVDVRWMRGDFWGVYVELSPLPHKDTSHGCEVDKRYTQGGCEVMGVWCLVAPSTTQSPCMDLRWMWGECEVDMRWIRGDTRWMWGGHEVTLGVCMLRCPIHHTKTPHMDARWI